MTEERLVLSAYGRRCYDAGRASANKELVSALRALLNEYPALPKYFPGLAEKLAALCDAAEKQS